MTLFQDQLHRDIYLTSYPKRIISIVPSQTELLFFLGLNEEIVGITQYCIYPADKVHKLAKIGGTKKLDIERIKALKPDLVIANKEENDRTQVELLSNICPVWISDIHNLEEAIDMIEKIGKLTDKGYEAKILANAINRQFDNLTISSSGFRVAYLIWRKPYMVAGRNTFIDNMLQKCGFINAFELDRYPKVDVLDLKKADPDVVFLSSEPYPFREQHIAEIKKILPGATIKLVDGELFSWYGSRLLHAPSYFRTLFS